MCGICGFIDFRGSLPTSELCIVVERMSDRLAHRGPDDAGAWCDPEAGVALGHRRLSILDLSAAGHQPMVSHSGRYVIVLNGEIYNFREIRARLEALGHRFVGHSDTEVMLSAFEQWGVTAAVELFNGMFAFAVWDREERRLRLARDRMGEKPLYYAWVGNLFLFGSELKALKAHPRFSAEIDRPALALYLRHNYIPAPHSIYHGVDKLPPSTTICVSDAHPTSPTSYWSTKEIAEQGMVSPFTGSDQEAVDQLETTLSAAVRRQMVADVPLGAFLSGGVDSSTIVALMQAQSSRPVKTFTIGFHQPEYDEAGHARAVAKHLGTDHTELYVTAQETMDVIPQLPVLYDEPFADSSQIPTFLVCKLARQFVTVSLSGDGGDELFAGYRGYTIGRKLWNRFGWLPPVARAAFARLLTSPPIQYMASGIGFGQRFFGQSGQPGPLADKLQKLGEVISVPNREQFYRRLVSNWQFPTSILPDVDEPPTAFTNPGSWAALREFTPWMMFVDTISYLPDDILVKLDRASMNMSLESRVPFLDRHVVELAWQLPWSTKVREGKSKWVVKQILRKFIPGELMERPKQGFAIPLDSWLRGPLRNWAETLLDESRLRSDGIFSPAPIRNKWEEHFSGRRNWQGPLWNILMFQSWLAQAKEKFVVAEPLASRALV